MNNALKEELEELIEASQIVAEKTLEDPRTLELNAKIAKKQFELFKQEGFDDDQAIQLTHAVISKK